MSYAQFWASAQPTAIKLGGHARAIACAALSAGWAVASLVPGFTELRPGPAPYTVERVERVDDRYLHVYRTAAPAPATKAVVVFIHGGGWTAGGLETRFPFQFGYEFVGRVLASRGVDTALISYPLVSLPATVELGVYGALAALAWLVALLLSCVWLSMGFWLTLALLCYPVAVALLRQRTFGASYLIGGTASGTKFADQRATVREMYKAVCARFPGRPIVLVGHSAGAHHAALLTLDGVLAAQADGATRLPDAVVLLSGPYNLAGTRDAAERGDLGAWIADRLLLRHVFNGAEMTSASPAHLVATCHQAAAARPDMAWHVATALGDAPLLEAQADAFAVSLAAAFHKVHRLRGIGVGHGIGMVASEVAWALVELVTQRWPM